jgi:hypothetical protein
MAMRVTQGGLDTVQRACSACQRPSKNHYERCWQVGGKAVGQVLPFDGRTLTAPDYGPIPIES